MSGLVVDLFAGGGGTSLGIEWAIGRSPDIAINHDREAIAMHTANHPETLHYAEDVRKVDIRKVVAGRPVAVLWLSPDCKHHSKAKGGKPVDRKIRGLAWEAVRWAEQARPALICLENVQEFRDWGPLGKDKRPDRLRRGITYRQFQGRLRALGYQVEDRLLRACDFGAPTTRERLFLVARCDGLPIVWPAPTHARDGRGGLQPWRTAAECLDFALPCPSIFLTPGQARELGVRRPLAEKTERRIARGIRRFVLDSPRPYIVRTDHHQSHASNVFSAEGPLSTITSARGHAVVAPTIVPVNHGGDLRTHAVQEPLRTITGGHRGEHALVAPVLATIDQQGSGPAASTAPGAPLPTTVTKNRHALVAPVLVPRYGEREGQAPRTRTVEQPAATIVPTQNGDNLVAAYLAKHYGGHEATGSQLRLPVDTITARDHNALVASSLLKLRGQCNGAAVDAPLPAVTAQGTHLAEVRAFLIRYHDNGGQWSSLFDPSPTVVATDSIGLVMVDGAPHVIVDIGMRMLIARELFRCQGFPDTYQIDVVCDRGKRKRGRLPAEAQVRMVGNSVPPQLAAALVRANLPETVRREDVA